jgi:prepilin-type N-terminal cleavage/methylation domain-containing protein
MQPSKYFHPRSAQHTLTLAFASRPRRVARGYSLVEVMAVVVIVGILAAIGTYSVRRYLLSAKTAEASSMITQIRAAEEAYRDEAFVYLGLSSFSAWHPVDDPGSGIYEWHTTTALRTTVFDPLGVEPNGPVRYVYSVVAGNATTGLPANPGAESFDFPAPDGPFYIVAARADLDGDGHFTYAIAHSDSSSIFIDQGF